MGVSRIKYYKNISTPRHPTWFSYYKNITFPTQIFRVLLAVLCSGEGPEQRARVVPSEKCAVGWGSDDDEMRMITVSFVRAIEQFAGDLCPHFLPLFQQVVALRKTCIPLIQKFDTILELFSGVPGSSGHV